MQLNRPKALNALNGALMDELVRGKENINWGRKRNRERNRKRAKKVKRFLKLWKY